MYILKISRKVFIFQILTIIITIGVYYISVTENAKYSTIKTESSIYNYIAVGQLDDNISSKIIDDELDDSKTFKSELVYDNMTLDELSEKINRSLNSTISGKGYLIASHSLELGVDPYMATAIILQETGCKWNCSYLVKSCNNVGGQKGSGCGSYSYFDTLDSGIIAFIDNLYNNYISYGLTTPESINPKYAEDVNWSINVNKYIEEIKAH